MTREVFDTFIIVVMIIGAALAAVRLYQDFTRPLDDDDVWSNDDTQPHQVIEQPSNEEKQP